MINVLKNEIEQYFNMENKNAKKEIQNPDKKRALDNSLKRNKQFFKLIIKELSKGYKEKNNKIVLDFNFWLKLSTETIFTKYSFSAHYFSKFLIEKRYVSVNSIPFIKNNKIISINKLSNPFLNCDLNTYDKCFLLKEKLLATIEATSWQESKNSLIYIYLKLFTLQQIPDQYLQYLCRANLFQLNKSTMAFIFTLDSYKGFRPIKTIIVDKQTNELFNTIFFNAHNNLIDVIDHVFTHNISDHVAKLNKYTKEHAITKKECNNAIALQFQLHSSPLKLTIETQTRYPKLSLIELDILFKNKIDKRLLKIEQKNFEIFNQSNPADENDEEEDEIDLDEYLGVNFEIYDKFKQIKYVPQKKDILTYVIKWNKFLTYHAGKIKELSPIFNYCLFLLEKADKREHKNPIKAKTLQGYFQILFDYCFIYTIICNDNNEATTRIYDNLEHSDLKIKSKRKYRRVINSFITYVNNKKLSNINSLIDYNKSIVFEKELDKLINALRYKDKDFKQDILKQRRISYVILLYYTGLRKNELTSRLARDISYINDKTFVIDVNRNGINRINEYLKKDNAVSIKGHKKRKVEFSIPNIKHFNIVKNYLDNVEKNGNVFLFPELNKSNTISKYRAIKLQSINDINSMLKKITKRYTTLHSIRHTYATNEMFKMLKSSKIRMKDIFELAQKMGHSNPDTTISNYVHLDLIKLLLSYKC